MKEPQRLSGRTRQRDVGVVSAECTPRHAWPRTGGRARCSGTGSAGGRQRHRGLRLAARRHVVASWSCAAAGGTPLGAHLPRRRVAWHRPCRRYPDRGARHREGPHPAMWRDSCSSRRGTASLVAVGLAISLAMPRPGGERAASLVIARRHGGAVVAGRQHRLPAAVRRLLPRRARPSGVEFGATSADDSRLPATSPSSPSRSACATRSRTRRSGIGGSGERC